LDNYRLLFRDVFDVFYL